MANEMPPLETGLKSPTSPPATANQVISHLKQEISGGKPWYPALLAAIHSWELAEETHEGRRYRYLVADEALDWLLLAERLCQAVDNLLPREEKEALLFHGRPPLELTREQFKELLGDARYGQYLNYFYGITVEEALFLAVQEEVRKEWRTQGLSREQDAAEETFLRIYGTARPQLLSAFRQQTERPQSDSISLSELKEFTYWLFKHRLEHADKDRVASDTRKALKQLDSLAWGE
jgi:hypothetical protein